MLRRRVIPCLDVRGGRLVKGVNFESLRDCGDPVDAAERYAADGADEIVWLNIAAGDEDWRRCWTRSSGPPYGWTCPLCVGGGVDSEQRARELLLAGADKVSSNSAPLDRPELVSELADRFGSQCVVIAIDAARNGGGWPAFASGRPARDRPGRDRLGARRRSGGERASCW